ncbi:alpha-glucosidase/alpha-galactosidase [Anaerotalea alkaliphila]|uniref:Alpha-glucosidase/alpha-galactosidase n=1 Tax=Anaerotalea alkaliphila TaxID=2662126 RepID=A0A7X5KMK7_9FIRM|nr:alpha-glucosidase/alpha-galactosidase [Anaerotalea alkaliphila]NDL67064.1 alpha-glucosidase/alpha-galactosidase [Anaerotalea alkaliphila]
MNGINIAYIGGGSRGWAWGLMSDLALEPALCGTVRLYDIDMEAARENAIIGNRLAEREDVVSSWRYEVSASLEKALAGADFVVISILPGSLETMAVDVHTPERYGIFQAVGDTVGPGGAMRAFRTIPLYIEIAEAIRDHAPDAWVINYTNPMSVCTRTLYRVFPGIKAIGNCHEVFGTQKLLARALEEVKGVQDVTREEIRVNVLGINHFTWITRAAWRDIDLFPVYEAFVEKHHAVGYESEQTGNWMNDFFSSANRVKFDLFRRYGVIAAAGDRHLAEFCPNRWYLKDAETVRAWKFSLTPVAWRLENQKERLEKGRRLAAGLEPFALQETGEEGVRQMKALLGLGDLVTNVNLPNRGQIPSLPMGAIVETNALFTRDSVTPIQSGTLPLPVLSMVERHIRNQEGIVEATFTRDRHLAFQTFLNDPLVDLDLPEAEACFRAMDQGYFD